MATSETHSRPVLPRVVLALVVLGAAGWVAGRYLWPAPRLVEVVAIPPAVTAPAATAVPHAAPLEAPERAVVSTSPQVGQVAPAVSAPAPTASGGPSFDIVRVGPEGTAVIAGRAPPGAEVVVRDGASEVARGRADRQGSFVVIPPAPLAEGSRELTLASREAGRPEIKGDASVLLDVPRSTVEAPAAPAVAVLVPSAGPARVLQDPPVRATGRAVTLDTVDYDDTGAIRFTGGAAAGGALRLYIDNAAAGDARADAAGRWTVTPTEAVTAGVHTVRVDHLGSDGQVLARVELPFQRVAVQPSEVAGGRVVVQPGQSLWRLARQAYGRGLQYRVIYLANREQIRDPRLIYPGQTFAVPAP